MNAHDAIRKAAHDAVCRLRIPHSDHIWVSPIPFFDDVADAIEEAVKANGYSIHLTDDGVAAPPADQTVQQVQQHLGSGVAAERATTTAAPSSPHPDYSDTELEVLIAARVPHRGMDGFTLNERRLIAAAVAPLVRELIAGAS